MGASLPQAEPLRKGLWVGGPFVPLSDFPYSGAWTDR